MKYSLSNTLQYILEVARRRSMLLILPIAIILPLGLAFAKFGPKTYVAKALLLMQESGVDYPFTRELPVGIQIPDRVLGLRALIKSDLVLNTVMGDVLGSDAPTDPKEIASWIKSFSRSLTLEMVGNEFLEIQLKGFAPRGLGRQLEAVTSRFLEALLSTDDTLSATQVLLDRRREELSAAQRALAQFKMHTANRSIDARSAELIRQKELELDEKTRQLVEVRSALEEMRSHTTMPAAKSVRSVSQDTIEAEEQVAAGASRPGVNAVTTNQPANELAKIRQTRIRAQYRSLQAEVDQLTEAVSDMRQSAVDKTIKQQLVKLETAVERASQEYQSLTKRFGSQSSGVRAQGLLRAPERIKLIDPPRDPELPSIPPLIIALAVAMLSLVTSVGMVTVAELLDTTVRRPEQLEALTGVPTLARLPRI